MIYLRFPTFPSYGFDTNVGNLRYIAVQILKSWFWENTNAGNPQMPDAGSVGSGIHAVCRSISLLSLYVTVEKKSWWGDGRHLGNVTKTINTILHHHWTSLELPPSKSVTTVPGVYNRFIIIKEPLSIFGAKQCQNQTQPLFFIHIWLKLMMKSRFVLQYVKKNFFQYSWEKIQRAPKKDAL